MDPLFAPDVELPANGWKAPTSTIRKLLPLTEITTTFCPFAGAPRFGIRVDPVMASVTD